MAPLSLGRVQMSLRAFTKTSVDFEVLLLQYSEEENDVKNDIYVC